MRSADVLVVGGGPGGCLAALHAATAGPGLDVLLVERDDALGAPVRCAEGVGGPGLREFLDPAGAPCVAREISRVVFVAPDDAEVVVEARDPGYVLDRTRFEPLLAEQARGAGAEVRVGTEALGLARDGDGWAVRLGSDAGEETVRARVVIAADGVESMVGRWAGLDTRVASRDMASCAQYLLSDIVFDPDAITIHVGSTVAPCGYAWVFPKGVGIANVGLEYLAQRGDGRSARGYLDAYVQRRFPGGTVRSATVGGVITATTLRHTVTDGLMLVGDAAHQINPLSGGGIIQAMKAGRIAGRVAAGAVRAGDTSERRLSAYHAEWMALLGDDHVRYRRIKQALDRCDDAFYDALARTVNAVPPEKRTVGRVFMEALVRHPRLLPVAARLFLDAIV